MYRSEAPKMHQLTPGRAAGTYLNMVRTGPSEMDPLVPSNPMQFNIMHLCYSTQNPEEPSTYN